MPPRDVLEKAAEIIYSAAEFVPDGRINIKGVGDWVDQNENIMAVFLQFEPSDRIDEANSLFLPLKRNKEHLNVLSEKYLGRRIMKEIEPLMSSQSKRKSIQQKEVEEFKMPALNTIDLGRAKGSILNSARYNEDAFSSIKKFRAGSQLVKDQKVIENLKGLSKNAISNKVNLLSPSSSLPLIQNSPSIPASHS